MFKLPPLPYAYDALEPYIDAKTMEIHYEKHHQAYINKLNEALEKYPDLQKKSLDTLLTSLNTLPPDIQQKVRNNGGGNFNHTLFWNYMKKGGSTLKGSLSQAINHHFKTLHNFQELFSHTAKDIFGSGWAWLVLTQDNQLKIISCPNQDAPITQGVIPLLGLDVWEHAYYLKYQNKRPDYIDAWWHVVNWEFVQDQYEQGLKKI